MKMLFRACFVVRSSGKIRSHAAVIDCIVSPTSGIYSNSFTLSIEKYNKSAVAMLSKLPGADPSVIAARNP